MTLYIPRHCIVPLAVRENNTICGGAKVYLGEIHALANEQGRLVASNEDLAEMKSVSIRTIKNWNKQLREAGLIKYENGEIQVLEI